MRQYLPRYRQCFVCGGDNPKGLGLRPFLEDNQVGIEFTPQPAHMGFRDVVHGGILAALLDEVSFWVATLTTRKVCVTAGMSIRYKKPLTVGTPTTTFGRLLEKKGTRRVVVEAHARDAEGTEYALATSTFAVVPGTLAKAFPDDPSIGQMDFDAYPELQPMGAGPAPG